MMPREAASNKSQPSNKPFAIEIQHAGFLVEAVVLFDPPFFQGGDQFPIELVIPL